ncbi:alcohol dehydrogenase catalytic domain-containing protein [Egibacter rhizosphaerae]|uniref:alcohol dehydrogenase catalytic domain-containing protein n=1 Tax=Egibacter rhizosphaerae TaxID=1670831 RepID=UPI003B8326ED
MPVAGPGDELVRVDSVGICGSDLHWFTEGGIGDARLDEPLVIGHELAGTLVGGDRDGERVAIDPAIPVVPVLHAARATSTCAPRSGSPGTAGPTEGYANC